MTKESPVSRVDLEQGRAALLVGTAEVDAFAIRAKARRQSELDITAAETEILESNRQLLESIREELDRCRSRKMEAGMARASEMKQRAEARMRDTLALLSEAFERRVGEKTSIWRASL